jgi:hypothetical protein
MKNKFKSEKIALRAITLAVATCLHGIGYAQQTTCNNRDFFFIAEGDSCTADAMGSTVYNPQFSDGVWVQNYLSPYLDSTNNGTTTNININGQGLNSGIVGINVLTNRGSVTKMINVGYPWSDYYYSSNANAGRVNILNNFGAIQQGIAIHSLIHGGSTSVSSIGRLYNAAGASILNSGFSVTNPNYIYNFGISLWYKSYIEELDNEGEIKSMVGAGSGIYLYSGDPWFPNANSSYITTLHNRNGAVISGWGAIYLTGQDVNKISRIGDLNNDGLISGGGDGIGLTNSSTIDAIRNRLTGVISGGFSAVVLADLSSIGLIENAGSITGGSRGVSLTGSSSIATLTNLESGSIVAQNGGDASQAAISLSDSNTITNLNNFGSIRGALGSISSNEINAAIRVSLGSQITSLNNFATGSIGTILNNGVVGQLVNQGVISSIWNVGSTNSLRMSIVNAGQIDHLVNLQGPGNSSPLLYQGVLPTSYSIWIAAVNNYGQLSANGSITGRMTFNVSEGNAAITSSPSSASQVAITNNHLYEDVLTGISVGNLLGRKDGTLTISGVDYRWMLLRDNTILTTWDLCFGNACPNTAPVYAPLPNDTYESFLNNSYYLLTAFNLQSTKIAQGLSYDCTVYDQKNICVSFAGSKSDGKGFDATTGALIIAHKPSNNFRFGGYIDQSFGSSTSGGLTTKNGNPGFGAFAVWSQNADGSGVQVRAAATVGKVDIETTREAIESAEAGFGKSNIKSQGFSLEVSKDYAINSMWSVRPYVGYRKTTNTRAGYTEQSSNDVTAPLTYSSLKQTTETLTAGATFAHTLSAKTTLFLMAGVEHDLKNRIGNYVAANDDIGDIDSIDMGSNKTKTRPTVSFALNHDIDKTQRVGLSLTHRKEAFASGSATSAYLLYSKGF